MRGGADSISDSELDPGDTGDLRCTEEGDKTCSEQNSVLVCSLGADNLLYWTEETLCADFEKCGSGVCKCNTSKCTLNNYQCHGAFIQKCLEKAPDCNEWADYYDCATVETGFTCFSLKICARPKVILNQLQTGDHGISDNTDSGGAPTLQRFSENQFAVVWYTNEESSDWWIDDVRLGIFNTAGSILATDIWVNQYQNDGQDGAVIAVTGPGEIIVLWQNQYAGYTDSYRIMGRRFNSLGNPWGNEYTLSGRSAQLPSIFKLTDQTLVASWSFCDLDRIYGSSQDYYLILTRFDSSGSQILTQNHLLVNPVPGLFKTQLSELPNNKFLVAWWDNRISTSADPKNLFFQAFNLNLAPVSSTYSLNVQTVDYDANSPYIIPLSENRFMITWMEGDYDSHYFIYGNVYEYQNSDTVTLVKARTQVNQAMISSQRTSIWYLGDKGDQLCIIWNDLDGIYGRRIDSAGNWITSQLRLIQDVNPEGVSGLKLSANRYWIVWGSVYGTVGNHNIVGQWLSVPEF